ncbi:MFS transporter [Azospirillum sp. sgz302134]
MTSPSQTIPTQGGAAAAPASALPRHRWTILAIGFAANAGFSAAISGIPTTAVFMRNGYGIGNGELGMVLGAMGLGIAVSELPWGMLTDRWGDRRVLLTGLGLTALVLALMALFVAPTPFDRPPMSHLALGLFLIGLFGGSLNGASGRAVMAWFHEGERGLAMSIRQTALPAGGAVGALILPPLVASLGFAAAYGVLALLVAAAGGATWLWLHEPPGEAAAKRAAPAHRAPLRDPRIWRVVTGIGALCMPQVAVLTFAVVFLHDASRLDPMTASACIVVVQIGAAALRIAAGFWTDRRKNRRGFLRACGLATMAVFLVLGALVAVAARDPGLLDRLALPIALAVVAGGMAASCWHGIAYTELATIAGTSRAGTALGLGNSFAFSAYVLTPLAIPALLALSSWAVVWLSIGLCAFAAFLLFPKAEAR